MEDWKTYLIVAPVALVVGIFLGLFVTYYIIKKQIKKWQKKMEQPDKEQIRNMLSAFGQKPSEEQVNRLLSMTENLKKKKQSVKTPKKKKQ